MKKKLIIPIILGWILMIQGYYIVNENTFLGLFVGMVGCLVIVTETFFREELEKLEKP